MKGAIMPDSVNIIKICAILAIGAISVGTAAHFTESYVAEASAREKTLAEAVIQNRLEEEIKKAEEEAVKQFEEQGETIVTTVMETKPPVTEPPVTTTSETTVTTEETTVTEVTEITETTAVPETTVTETETSGLEDEIITEFKRGGLLPEDRTGIPKKSMFALTAQEQETVT
ncbi:MAG: hypothetical protein K2J76_04210, partial [Oscillospiraceae bacterium]|nr:hypothetical protein [Oscillospiraceae bacterium]